MKTKVNLEKDIEVTSSSPDDPRLKKKWGFISALPSEYLIHYRKGKFSEKTSGQGAGCFKWFTDNVFIIPTSLKEIVFEANQLTNDNVDVRIRGMAVYRINDPLKIYKRINFSSRQSAEEKLARMIGDMCRSNTKWLVANMKVDECIRKRKEDIADALKSEVSRIIGNEQSGWGVEIVTIDIQDVYIQDAEIFHALQMMFKSDKIRESKLAQMEMERTVEIKTLEKDLELAEHRKNTELNKARIEAEVQKQKMETQKSVEIGKLENERELAEHRKNTEILKSRIEEELLKQKAEVQKIAEIRKLEDERSIAEHQKIRDMDKAKNEAEIKEKQILLSKKNEEHQFGLDHYRVEQNEAIARYKFEQEIEREKEQIQLKLEKTEKEVQAQKMLHEEESKALRERIDAENSMSSVGIEKLFIEKALPSIAEVMAKTMKDVKISMLQGDTGKTPFTFILTELMQIFRDRITPLRDESDKSEKPA